jgi:diguanylate cyclase (GGDEF)-like protein/PAS domain S-box-containing protein
MPSRNKRPGKTDYLASSGLALRRKAEKIARKNSARSLESLGAMTPETTQKMLYELQVHQIELEMQNVELLRAREYLDTALSRYFDLYHLAPVGYFTLSEQNLILEANLSAATQLGVDERALIKQPITRFILKADQDIFYLNSKQLFKTGEPQTCELRMVKHDGMPFWAQLTGTTTQNADGNTVCRLVLSDITEGKQAEEKLQLAASVFTHTHEGIMITAVDGTIIDVNDAFSRITEYSRAEVLGQSLQFLNFSFQEKEFYAAIWNDLVEKGQWSGEVWNRRKNGEVYAVIQNISAVRDDQGNIQRFVSLFSDITLLKEHERELEHIAHHDVLTGLPNRVLLADRLQQGMAQTRRQKKLMAVAFLDLDRFKTINDDYGHEAGDQLLITVAIRMKQTLRESDTLIRLGGDEFVVVLLDLADIEASVPMLNRLLAAAGESVQFGDITLKVSASLGVTFYPQTKNIDADQLLHQADQAMYQAKQAGKNRCHFFDHGVAESIKKMT